MQARMRGEQVPFSSVVIERMESESAQVFDQESSPFNSFIYAHCHFSRSGRERKLSSEDAMRPSTTMEYASDSMGPGLGPAWSTRWILNAPTKSL